MYDKLSSVTILTQLVFFMAAMPFVIRQIRLVSRYRELGSAMYGRMIRILEDVQEYDWSRGMSLEYVDEMKLDYEAASAWRRNPKDRLRCLTAFVDKWEAMEADGKILRIRN